MKSLRGVLGNMQALRNMFRVDPLLLLSVLLLLGVGAVVIYSGSGPLAESKHLPASYFMISHLKKIVLGLICMGIGLRVDHQIWVKFARPFFYVSILLLVGVLVLGFAAHGATRWLSIGGFDFQPSEIMKISIIFLLAAKLAEAGEDIQNFKIGFVRPLILVGLVFLLIILQPNYSMATSIFFVCVVMMFAAGTQVKHLALLGLAAIPAVVVLAITSSYRLKRVMAFMDPTGHTGSSYQQLQSLISLGNGGLFGTGLGQGTQKLGYLPMPFTDTIYAILGEEMGFLGTTLVLGLFLIVMWRGYMIARHSTSRFGRNVAVALTTALGLNVFMHVGVCTRILPATGQPLPLVSFGGSSLLMNLFAMGVLLNLSNPDTGKGIKETTGGLV